MDFKDKTGEDAAAGNASDTGTATQLRLSRLQEHPDYLQVAPEEIVELDWSDEWCPGAVWD